MKARQGAEGGYHCDVAGERLAEGLAADRDR
jgi:hypothetical protein